MPNMGTSPYPSNVDIVVTTKGVTKLLKALNPKKAVGPDMIPTTILHDHAETLAPAVQVIFQQSLDTGVSSADWTNANISAVFKKGSNVEPANYQPVSLASVCSKILEHSFQISDGLSR